VKNTDNLVYPSLDGTIIFKWILRRAWAEAFGLRTGTSFGLLCTVTNHPNA